MKYLKLISLAYLALIASCSNKVSSPDYSRWFPLEVGFFWEYQSEQYIFYKEIIDFQRLPNGEIGYQQKIIHKSKIPNTPAIASFSTLAIIGNELREYYDTSCENGYRILLRFPLKVGDTWNGDAPGPCPWVNPDGETLYVAPLGQTSDSVAIREDVTVPAGRFKSCYRIHQLTDYPTATSFYQFWFTPNVGFVKWTYDKYFNVDPIGPASYADDDYVLIDFGSTKSDRLKLPLN